MYQTSLLEAKNQVNPVMKMCRNIIRLQSLRKKKNLKKEKKNPPNRIRTSDLRISALPLQSSALPTELSAVTLKSALYLSFYCTLGHLSMNLHKSLSIFCPWRKYDIINNSYLSFWHFFSHFSMFIIAKNKLNSLKNSK